MAKTKDGLDFIYKPRSKSQKEAELLWEKSRILFFLGKAGTGKTACALGMAIRDALQSTDKETNTKPKLWLARPQIACGERMGYLPGDMEAKISPWLAPFYDCFETLSTAQWATLEKKIDIESVSVGMLRGRTIRGQNSVLIVDESQQLDASQIVCILTRLGEGAKIVLTGDPAQSDRFDLDGSPMMDAARKLEHLEVVNTLVFKEQLRDPLVASIADALT